MPVSLDDVVAMVAALPEVSEGESYGRRTWFVRGKGFAWERPFSKADVKRFGDETPPDGDILAVRVEDLHEKEAVLAEGRPGFFTIQHFDGFAALLIQLKRARKRDVNEALVDAWLALAPPKLAEGFLAESRPQEGIAGI